MTRNGKIARLPHKIREELNCRLLDAEDGKTLVEWLNSQDEVKAVLAAKFGGRPITKQNLSEWKARGFLEWQRHQAIVDGLRGLAERSEDIELAAGPAGAGAVSDRVAAVFAAELLVFTEKILAETTDPNERWRRLVQALRELRGLRCEDHKRQRMLMAREEQKLKAARQMRKDAMKAKEQQNKQLLRQYSSAISHPNLLALLVGGEAGEKMAGLVNRNKNELPVELNVSELGGVPAHHADPEPPLPGSPVSVSPSPSQSNPVKTTPCQITKGDAARQAAMNWEPCEYERLDSRMFSAASCRAATGLLLSRGNGGNSQTESSSCLRQRRVSRERERSPPGAIIDAERRR
jgi:hypothetical protein